MASGESVHIWEIAPHILAATELVSELISTMRAQPEDQDIDVDCWLERLLDVQTELWRVRWPCGLTAERSDLREQLAARLARIEAEQAAAKVKKEKLSLEEDAAKLAREHLARGEGERLRAMLLAVLHALDEASPKASGDDEDEPLDPTDPQRCNLPKGPEGEVE